MESRINNHVPHNPRDRLSRKGNITKLNVRLFRQIAQSKKSVAINSEEASLFFRKKGRTRSILRETESAYSFVEIGCTAEDFDF